MTYVGQKSEKGYQALNRGKEEYAFNGLALWFKGLIMKLNFKGFFKAAGLCPLALALPAVSRVLWFPIPQRVVQESINGGQTPSQGLSLAKDSNGTKGYVFVGESLDYLSLWCR